MPKKQSCLAIIAVIAHWITASVALSIAGSSRNESTMPVDRRRNSTRSGLEPRSLFPSVAEFYPEINQDLTQVTWAHGVDSRKKLHQALRGNTMMIEADVSLGTIKHGSSSVKSAIMAHPPLRTSDLSLEEFLDTTLNYVRPKGIKLDIKDIDVLNETLNLIKARETKFTVPLWLNADILQGPVDSSQTPLDAHRFLNSVKNYFPSAVISVGWTTRYGPGLKTSRSVVVIKEGSYTFEHVRQMRDDILSANIQQPVTFPIRAGLSTTDESRKNILWLLDQIPGSTLTVWGSFYDNVDVAGLMDLIQVVGKERIYIDVPSGLRCQIARYRSMKSTSSLLLSFFYSVGRRASGRVSVAAGLLAFLAYVTCASSYLPWNDRSYTVA